MDEFLSSETSDIFLVKELILAKSSQMVILYEDIHKLVKSVLSYTALVSLKLFQYALKFMLGRPGAPIPAFVTILEIIVRIIGS